MTTATKNSILRKIKQKHDRENLIAKVGSAITVLITSFALIGLGVSA